MTHPPRAVPDLTRHPLMPEELDRQAIVTPADLERVIANVQTPLLRALLTAKPHRHAARPHRTIERRASRDRRHDWPMLSARQELTAASDRWMHSEARPSACCMCVGYAERCWARRCVTMRAISAPSPPNPSVAVGTPKSMRSPVSRKRR